MFPLALSSWVCGEEHTGEQAGVITPLQQGPGLWKQSICYLAGGLDGTGLPTDSQGE